mmetsp:Transcript_1431/g.3843  ORF Transcript_1431/g.3843 Transcript_1431/m.3843 type:complete len:251 (-) Transcript_1431:1160-1912(-)
MFSWIDAFKICGSCVTYAVFPLTCTLPPVLVTRPARPPAQVDFPEPTRPHTATISPGLTWRDTPRRVGGASSSRLTSAVGPFALSLPLPPLLLLPLSLPLASPSLPLPLPSLSFSLSLPSLPLPSRSLSLPSCLPLSLPLSFPCSLPLLLPFFPFSGFSKKTLPSLATAFSGQLKSASMHETVPVGRPPSFPTTRSSGMISRRFTRDMETPSSRTIRIIVGMNDMPSCMKLNIPTHTKISAGPSWPMHFR